MADVNTAPEPINYKIDEDCLPGNVVRDSAGNPIKNSDGSYRTSGVEVLDPGPQAAKSQAIQESQRVPKSYLFSIANPDPPGGIGRLSRLQVKAIMSMMAKSLSGNSYSSIGPSNYVGKYQISPSILTAFGYVKTDFFFSYGVDAVKKDSAWTGKDSIKSLPNWFLSTGVQEQVMYQLMQNNYTIMTNNDAIKTTDNLCTIAGMLCVAHILGAEPGTERIPGARFWRQTGSGQDLTGKNAAYYFSLGRYAVDVLAAQSV